MTAPHRELRRDGQRHTEDVQEINREQELMPAAQSASLPVEEQQPDFWKIMQWISDNGKHEFAHNLDHRNALELPQSGGEGRDKSNDGSQTHRHKDKHEEVAGGGWRPQPTIWGGWPREMVRMEIELGAYASGTKHQSIYGSCLSAHACRRHEEFGEDRVGGVGSGKPQARGG